MSIMCAKAKKLRSKGLSSLLVKVTSGIKLELNWKIKESYGQETVITGTEGLTSKAVLSLLEMNVIYKSNLQAIR